MPTAHEAMTLSPWRFHCLLAAWLCGQFAQAGETALPVDVTGSWRLRYEAYDTPVGIPQSRFDDVLVSRLLVAARVGGPGLHVFGELQDSRAWLDSPSSPIGTDDVNAMELLQAQVGWDGRDVFTAGDSLEFQGGRMTIDAGSRRLVARNAFRNTINAFTGANIRWQNTGGQFVQGFLTLPVDRQPDERELLGSDSVRFDEERLATVFGGLRLIQDNAFAGSSVEIYVYALAESDATDAPTRNRHLWTPGLQLLREPTAGALDFDVEAALQLGTSRATAAASDTRGLRHRAGLVHLGLGWTPAALPSLRVVALFDYASGDGDPDDRVNGRFDTLFGARRFEFGPTGIWGLLARSNILSPALRGEWSAAQRTRLMVQWRPAWLAAERDALTSTGQRDASGSAGGFIGHQVEFSATHEVIPKRFALEAGMALLAQGDFLRNSTRITRNDRSLYGYLQGTLSF
jgi:hypothetical protein